MKHNQPKFFFNPDDGSSLCIITTKAKTYLGSAQCREADRDMMSEKTGCEIAYHRAIIHALEDRLSNLQNELSGLNKYFYTVNQSKHFQPKGYMERMLHRQIQQREDDIEITKNMIETEKKYLKQFMADKAEFYQKVRRNRKADSNK